jgi:hypothetical protein
VEGVGRLEHTMGELCSSINSQTDIINSLFNRLGFDPNIQSFKDLSLEEELGCAGMSRLLFVLFPCVSVISSLVMLLSSSLACILAFIVFSF